MTKDTTKKVEDTKDKETKEGTSSVSPVSSDAPKLPEAEVVTPEDRGEGEDSEQVPYEDKVREFEHAGEHKEGKEVTKDTTETDQQNGHAPKASSQGFTAPNKKSPILQEVEDEATRLANKRFAENIEDYQREQEKKASK